MAYVPQTAVNSAAPAYDAKAVTPNDSNDLTSGVCRGLFIGGAGNVVLVTAAGTQLTFTGCTAGSILPVAVQRVLATNTTATSIVALY